MDPTESHLNLRDIATRIAMDMMRHVRAESIEGYGPIIIEWAKNYGAQIENEKLALERLWRALPEPAHWPTVEVTPATKISLNNDTPKIVKPRTTAAVVGKTAKDFQKITVPDGVKGPLCPVERKSGSNKGQPCGKTAVYVTAAHRPNDNEDCRNLVCGHCFCGTHIKGAESDDAAAYDKLAAAASADGNTVSINVGGKKETIKPEVQTALDEDKGKQFGNAVLDKLMQKVKSKADGQK